MSQNAGAAEIAGSEADWRVRLTPEQYRATRQHGTERPFTGPLWDEKAPGLYSRVCCGAPLFDAAAKYESGTGWPSVSQPVSASALAEHVDRSLLTRRVEVPCARCDAHPGHVFEDGPRPTGKRYCMNGQALAFERREAHAGDATS